MSRPSIGKTQMETARLWALRSTCERLNVGAVISLGGRTIGSGFNGAPAGMIHCVHELPFMPNVQDLSKVRTRISPVPLMKSNLGCRVAIHAETNAIAYAARHGVAVAGADLYVTHMPCYPCAQLIIAAGLHRVTYDQPYRDTAGVELMLAAGLTVEKWIE